MIRTAFIAALFITTAASAYQLKQDNTGTTVRWNGAVNFVVDASINDRLRDPQAMKAILDAAETLRATVPHMGVAVEAGAVTGVGYDRTEGAKNQNEIVALAEWPFDKSFIAATVLTLDTRTHEILDADIAFNTQHRTFKALTTNSKDVTADDIQNTMTHELGHALGLAHNPEQLDVVMYPAAKKGEVQKRQLAEDDRAGLLALYGVAPLEAETASMANAGCSSVPAAPFHLGLLALLAMFARRRMGGRAVVTSARRSVRRTVRTAALATALAAPMAMASGAVEPAQVKSANSVFTAEVKSIRTKTSTTRLLFSEVELQVRGCLKGECPATVKVLVPGGRSGHIEQVVMGRPVPTKGTLLGVTLQRAPSGDTAPPSATSLYQLDQADEFQAFAEGVSDAGLALSKLTPEPVAER